MPPFDPFSSGAAVEAHPEGAAFDPFASGGAEPEVHEEAQVMHKSSYGDNWANLYGGLDTLDQRLAAPEKLAFRNLDDVSDNSKAARAQAINQAYVQSVLGDPNAHPFIERNWPAVRDAFANQIGISGKDITDTQLYGAIAKLIVPKPEESASGGENLADTFAGGAKAVDPWEGISALGTMHLMPGGPATLKEELHNSWEAFDKPLVDFPDPPDDLPNLPHLQMGNPALAGGVYKGLKPILESLTSPFSIVTLGAGAELKAATAAGEPLAKAALKGMTGLFSAWMGYSAVKGAIKAPSILRDPNASLQDQVAAVVQPVAEAAMSLAGVMDLAFSKMPEAKAKAVAKALEGKTPAEGADALRAAAKEAVAEPEKTEIGETAKPAQESYAPAHDFLMDAAHELDRLATPEAKEVIKEGKKAEKSAEKAAVAHDEALNPLEAPVKEEFAPEAKEDFNKWFEGSKVVDSEGKPLVVFRGQWKKRPLREKTDIFFTSDKESATEYAGKEPESHVLESNLSLKNPVIIDAKGGHWTGAVNEAIKRAKEEGRDGAIIKNVIDNVSEDSKRVSDTYVVFSRENVRDSVNPAKTAVEAPTPKAVSIKNEAVDAEMESMGLHEPTHGEKTTFEKARADAAKRLEEDSHAGSKLVEELHDKPRAPSAMEDALLTHELNRLKIERDAAENELLASRETGDQANVMDAMIRVRRAREAYSEAADVATKVGTASGQSLAFRRLALKEDYSLARLEHRMRVSKKGEAPTEAELAPIRELHAKLEEAAKRISEYETKAREAQAEPAVSESRTEAPKKRPPSKVSSFISEQAKAARERIKTRQAEGRTYSNPLDPQAAADAAIIGAEYVTKGVTKFADWSAAMIKELGENIRPYLADIFNEAIDATKQASKLEAYKRRTETAIAKTKDKLASGDLSKPERKSITLDPEAVKLKAEYQRVKDALDREIYNKEQASRHPFEKFVDKVLQYRKVGLISGIHTLGKVTAAGQARIGMTAADSAIGSVLNKLPGISDIAEGAPREGLKTGATAEHAVKGYIEGWKHTVDQAWNVLKYGKTDVEVLAGKGRGDVSLINYLVNTHALAKLPAFAQEYHISLRERTAYEIARGTDMENPINQMRVNNEAVQDGLRAKFSQDNFVTDRFNMLLRSMDGSKQHPTTGKAISAVLRFLFPIVKIPSNFFAEGITYSNLGAGIPRAAIKTIQAMQKGVETLTPAQKDSIMRHWKKGSLGAGLMLLGYYMRDDIGGYYQPGKRKDSEPEFGGIRLFGNDIPRWLVHMPIMEPLHFGATLGHVFDNLSKKHPTEQENPMESAILAAAGLIEEAPYASGARNAVEALASGAQGKNARGEMLKGALLPRLVSELAEMSDTDSQGDHVKRKASSYADHLQSGIPVLREDLPRKK